MDAQKPATFAEDSRNVKIAGRYRVAATYASIRDTCPAVCPLKDSGCYAQGGNVGFHVRKLQSGPRLTAEQVARIEARLIRHSFKSGPVPQDGARGGRDLRIHVSGDARTARAAEILAKAAADYVERGGGAVWSYTHAWRSVRRASWGIVSVLASIEHAKDAYRAMLQGYAPAIVVASFPSKRAFQLPESSVRWIPCPAQTHESIACTDCRLCMNADSLRERGYGIAFEAHGAQKRRVLPILAQG